MSAAPLRLKKFVTTPSEHEQMLAYARQYNAAVEGLERHQQSEFQAALLSQLILREIRRGSINPNLFQKVLDGMIEKPEDKPQNQ